MSADTSGATGGIAMADYAKTLQIAREQMVKARRDVAAELAKPPSAQTTPKARETFITIQGVIDQIDKAIVDEQKVAPPPG